MIEFITENEIVNTKTASCPACKKPITIIFGRTQKTFYCDYCSLQQLKPITKE